MLFVALLKRREPTVSFAFQVVCKLVNDSLIKLFLLT